MGEAFEELHLFFVIRRILQIDLEFAFGQNALLMAEGFERGRAMIGAHSAPADPAERKVIVREVHDRVVDATATKRRFQHHGLRLFLIRREIVEG